MKRSRYEEEKNRLKWKQVQSWKCSLEQRSPLWARKQDQHPLWVLNQEDLQIVLAFGLCFLLVLVALLALCWKRRWFQQVG